MHGRCVVDLLVTPTKSSCGELHGTRKKRREGEGEHAFRLSHSLEQWSPMAVAFGADKRGRRLGSEGALDGCMRLL